MPSRLTAKGRTMSIKLRDTTQGAIRRLSRIAATLTIFALLTDPLGRNVWIVKSAVVAIVPPVKGECDHDAHAKIYTVTLAICVAEDPEDVARKVGDF
jgi:hypothetical protein